MKPTTSHFKAAAIGPERYRMVEPLLRERVARGVDAALATSDPSSTAPLSPDEMRHLSQYYPIVKSTGELDMLHDMLTLRREFAISLTFSPDLIDACCLRGVFPMATEPKRGVFVFAPKLHVQRSVSRLVEEHLPGLPMFESGEALFDEALLHPKRALVKRVDVRVNQLDDVKEALQLIHLQHGENWLCEPLRACVVHMLHHPEAFKTKWVLFVLRGRMKAPVGSDLDAAGDAAVAAVEHRPIVAVELGYVVGDVYTSATGAYGASGCGSLQLAALGVWLRRSGVKLWDLGMHMEYKEACLRCSAIPRKQWMKLISAAAKRELPPLLADALCQRETVSATELLASRRAAEPLEAQEHGDSTIDSTVKSSNP